MDKTLVYDVGMHNGDDTAYYLSRGYRVVAIEANPTLAEKGQKRFAKEVREGRLQILNIGVGPEEGVLPFHVCEGNSEWSSFDPSLAARQGMVSRRVDVPCRRFGNVLREHGVPYYLKIDIEGYDRYCLIDLDPDDAPAYLSLELFWLEDLLLLRDLGYNAFKCIDQIDHTQLRFRMPDFKTWLKYRLKEHSFLTWLAGAVLATGKRVAGLLRRRGGPAKRGWVFPLGSSGPFAEDTDGDGQPLHVVIHSWLSYHLGFGDRAVKAWQDVHATRIPRAPYNQPFEMPRPKLTVERLNGSGPAAKLDPATPEVRHAHLAGS